MDLHSKYQNIREMNLGKYCRILGRRKPNRVDFMQKDWLKQLLLARINLSPRATQSPVIIPIRLLT